MSIQPKDLIHCGLYRHKETGKIVRFNSDMGYMYQVPGQKSGPLIVNGPGFTATFEPIPLTAEILTGWFGFAEDDGEIAVGIGSEPSWFKYPTTVYDSADGMYIDGCDIERPQVHDLQRLFLALTGELLEGGPENSDQINREE